MAKKLKILACDLDGVLRNFNSMINQIYNAELGIKNIENWINPDHRAKVYQLSENSEYNKEIIERVWKDHCFITLLHAKPYENFENFLKNIIGILSWLPDWENGIKFITHQHCTEAEEATQLWFDKYELFRFGELVFEHGDHKHNHCDALIDDKLENLYKGIDNKKDFVAIACAREWNEEILPKYKDKIHRGDYDIICTNLRVWL